MNLEIAKLALNAGAFGLNILIIALLYRLADKWAGKFLSGLNTTSAAIATLTAKIDALAKNGGKRRTDRRKEDPK